MIAGMLIRCEVLKARKRFGAIVTTLFFVALCALVFGQMAARRGHATPGNPGLIFPRAWSEMVPSMGGVTLFLVPLVLMMLIASEFVWRTARQNVIDGLSKNQWFAGKLLLGIIVCLLFALIALGIGSAFAFTNSFDTFMRVSDAKLIGAYFLALMGSASMAIFLSMIARTEGGAVGLFLVWAALGENLIMLILSKLHDGWGKFAGYLPFHVFAELLRPHNWDAESLRVTAELAQRMHRPAPSVLDMRLFTGLAAAYIVAFIAVSYVNYERRDL